jgi:pilus assembly protein CpaC
VVRLTCRTDRRSPSHSSSICGDHCHGNALAAAANARTVARRPSTVPTPALPHFPNATAPCCSAGSSPTTSSTRATKSCYASATHPHRCPNWSPRCCSAASTSAPTCAPPPTATHVGCSRPPRRPAAPATHAVAADPRTRRPYHRRPHRRDPPARPRHARPDRRHRARLPPGHRRPFRCRGGHHLVQLRPWQAQIMSRACSHPSAIMVG